MTTTVQILPFFYSALYIFVLALYNHAGESTMLVLDSLFYVSPAVVVSFLLLSKVLMLCRWNKIACLVPIIPQIVGVVDYFFVSFEDVHAYVFNCMIMAMTLLLLVAAYKVFFK